METFLITLSSIIPSIFTLLNLLLGFVAILAAGFNEFTISSWLIALAAILDFFDGRMARWFKSSSRFGAELDSLSDIVSFGVAPSILLVTFLWYLFSLPKFHFLSHYYHYYVFICFLPVMSGALRLARYNITQAVDLTKKHDFVGLPIPMSAMIIVSFVLYQLSKGEFTGIILLYLPLLILVVSLLMISQIRYKTFPKLSFTPLSNGIQLVLLFVFIALILIHPNLMLFPIMLIYLVSGVVAAVYSKIVKKVEPTTQEQL